MEQLASFFVNVGGVVVGGIIAFLGARWQLNRQLEAAKLCPHAVQPGTSGIAGSKNGQPDIVDRPERGSAPKTARRLPPDELAALIRDYRAGDTVYELAPRYGIDRRTIAAKLKQAGVTLRGHTPGQQEADRLVELYQSGLSLVAAGERVGYTSRTVPRALIERDVPRRDSHGRVRPNDSSPDSA